MYNLLVMSSISYDEWERNQGRWYDLSFFEERNRVLSYTDSAVKEKFTGTDGRADFDALIALPCLFTYEGRGVVGAIGQISKVKFDGRVLQIKYYLPSVYPKIEIGDNRVLEDLGIIRHEMGTTHWAVKDIDLFEAVTRLLYGMSEEGSANG